MRAQRPTPEELLVRAHEEADARRRGKFTVFFGAAPGVGKTYAMLEAARAERAAGTDVVVGVVETHGRYDTAALLLGLELLPRRKITHNGVELAEFDLDGALGRRPALLLVDELAHTNAPGARHAKRWQDVEELLDAGLDVYATLNVQHLASLRDVVAQITGVVVRETVPDALFDRADEVRLVDLPPDELLERLRDGKVYIPAQAKLAAENFFRKGNLIALRELALRGTAERVDAQMQVYRRDHGIAGTWATTERVLVCVSPSPESARLVRAARRLAARLQGSWIAVFVETPQHVSLSALDRQRLADNLTLAEQLGAETLTLAAEEPAEKLLEYAKQRNVTKLVLGKPTHPRWRDLVRPGFLDTLIRLSGDIDVYVIAGEGDTTTVASPGHKAPVPLRGYLAAALAAAGATAVSALAFGRSELADVVMVYLLGIVVVASRFGHGPSLAAAVLSVVAYDLYFIPPYFSFAVADFSHITTFFVMFVVAAVISALTQRVRRQAELARGRELRTSSLFELSRDLADARSIEELAQVVAAHIHAVFDCQTAIFLPGLAGNLDAASGATFLADERDRGAAEWVWLRERPAGVGTDTLPSARAHFVPLRAARGRVGVLALLPKDASRLRDPEQRQLLGTFAHQVAIAIERAQLSTQAQNAKVQIKTEQLRNSLLSSVSHDLRTPLAVVKGAGSALVEGNETLTPEARLSFAESIVDEADRLNRLVRNLLDMTRLEAGVLAVKKEWQSVEEIVGTALGRLEDRLRDRAISVDIPAVLPLVPCDALLMEQVLINLIENATKYTPEGTGIDLAARAVADDMEICVMDRGPGIPVGEEEKIFEKFHRAREVQGGIGLGLTICQGIIAAHGGRIWAKNREGGGAAFCLTLPLSDASKESQ
jgi:two-component system, OmpR family, sensor histidine kinase KdpD